MGSLVVEVGRIGGRRLFIFVDNFLGGFFGLFVIGGEDEGR